MEALSHNLNVVYLVCDGREQEEEGQLSHIRLKLGAHRMTSTGGLSSDRFLLSSKTKR